MAELTPAERAVYEQVAVKLGEIQAGLGYVDGILESFSQEQLEEAFADPKRQRWLLTTPGALDSVTQAIAAGALLLMSIAACAQGEAEIISTIDNIRQMMNDEVGGISLQDAQDLRAMFEAPAAEKKEGGDE